MLSCYARNARLLYRLTFALESMVDCVRDDVIDGFALWHGEVSACKVADDHVRIGGLVCLARTVNTVQSGPCG